MRNAIGMAAHLGPPASHDPTNPRKHIDAAYGCEAPVICGLPIEVGSGAKSTEWQLARHLVRVRVESGTSAAVALFNELRAVGGFDQRTFDGELVAAGFMSQSTADAAKKLAEYSPSDAAN
jgi:hypothetical protein